MALHEGEVALQFSKIVAPRRKGLSPYYHFRILAGTKDVGHINLRVGESDHVRFGGIFLSVRMLEFRRSG